MYTWYTVWVVQSGNMWFYAKICDVVQDSLHGGLIKGTNVETGTRYMQFTNFVLLISIYESIWMTQSDAKCMSQEIK